MFITKLLISSTQPSSFNIAWARPLADGSGFALYLPIDGAWRPIQLMNTKATPYNVEDDEVINVGNIGEEVEMEVTRQMAGHDDAVGDVHSATSSDESDYPEINIY